MRRRRTLTALSVILTAVLALASLSLGAAPARAAQCGCMPTNGGNAIYYECGHPPAACGGGGSSGRSRSYSSGSSAAGNLGEAIGGALGNAIMQGIMDGSRRRAAERAAAARAEEERLRQLRIEQACRQAVAEEERKIKLEQDKADLLGSLRGGSNMGFKGPEEQDLAFKEYHGRESG